jgi:hypothetical protein
MPVSPHTAKRAYYSATELRDILNISPSTFEDWLAKGRLPPAVRPGGPRGKRYWPVDVIDRYLAELDGARAPQRPPRPAAPIG